MTDAEALRALDEFEQLCWELPDWNMPEGFEQKAHETIGKLRAHLTDPGYVRVPVEPTPEMLNAAIDAHGHKLCDISRLGFRRSPQSMFRESYRAMLAAATKETSHD